MNIYFALYDCPFPDDGLGTASLSKPEKQELIASIRGITNATDIANIETEEDKDSNNKALDAN